MPYLYPIYQRSTANSYIGNQWHLLELLYVTHKFLEEQETLRIALMILVPRKNITKLTGESGTEMSST